MVRIVQDCATAVKKGFSACLPGKKHSGGVQASNYSANAGRPGAAFGEGALRYNPFSHDLPSKPAKTAGTSTGADKRKNNDGVPRARAFGEGALQHWH